MQLSARPILGLTAALGTMGFVMTAALTAPQPRDMQSAKAACPNDIKAPTAAKVVEGG
ncbi:MAG: hypothetical protein Q8R02_07165 [Hyphomonadaceae bacterium]|nr:hypothetical protein [Hyphomonadaceae bacterium]